jgi:hypothetical protein
MSKTYYGNLNVINPNVAYNNSSSLSNPLTSNLDCASYNIINVGNPSDPNDAVNLSYLNSVISGLPDASGVVTNPMTSNLDMSYNGILHLKYATIQDSVNTGMYTLVSENGSLTMMNNMDSEDIQHTLTVNETLGKPSFLDFRGSTLQNVNIIDLGGCSIGTNSSSEMTVNSNLNLQNNNLDGVRGLSFYNAPDLIIDLSNNLLYNNSVVINADNIQSYISQANWEPNASSDLNMNTHNIEMTTGKLVMNNNNINTDVDNDLSYNSSKVLVSKPKVLQKLHFVDSTPGTGIGIYELNPILFLNNSISAVGNLVNPVFDISINMVLQNNFSVNLDTAEINIGLSNMQNPLNSNKIAGLLTKTGGFTQNSDGSLSVRFRSDDSDLQGESWSNACALINSSNFYIYIQAQASAVTNMSTNIITVQSSTVYFNVIDTNNQFEQNEIININNNVSLQTYNTTPSLSLENGNNIITLFTVSPTIIENNNSIYFKTTLMGSNFCVKISCFIFDGSIIPETLSSSILYNYGNFQNCTISYTGGSIIGTIISQNTVAQLNVVCKSKIVIV